jgi:hypothetical protein
MPNTWVTRRKSPRRAFRRPIGALLHGEYSVTQARQLGEGGMLLQWEHSLKVGEQFVVTFILTDMTYVVVRAEVRYSAPSKHPGQPPFYGCQFINLPFEKKRAIRQYVADKSEREAVQNDDLP